MGDARKSESRGETAEGSIENQRPQSDDCSSARVVFQMITGQRSSIVNAL